MLNLLTEGSMGSWQEKYAENNFLTYIVVFYSSKKMKEKVNATWAEKIKFLLATDPLEHKAHLA